MKFILRLNKVIQTLIFISLMTASFLSFSQTYIDPEEISEAHTLYWKYRMRLRNDFLSIGTGQGQCLPAGQRYKFQNGVMNWGDATTNLGRYIGVLALEYKMLKENEQDEALEITKYELYCALKAIERLDNNYDEIEPWDDGEPTPGYFIRDDIGPTAFSNLVSDFNENTDLMDYPYVPFWSENISDFESDFIDDNVRLKEMSHDQAYSLMVGFALVKKFVDDEDVYIQGDNITPIWKNLHDMAVNEAVLILNHIAGFNSLGVDDWKVRRPDGEFVARGDDANFWAFGVLMIGRYLTGDDDYWLNPIIFPRGTLLYSRISWHLQQAGIVSLWGETATVNRGLIADIAAVGDSWRMGTVFPLSLIHATGHSLEQITEVENWDSYFIALWKALHDKDRDIPDNIYGHLISAPCIGPHYFCTTSGVTSSPLTDPWIKGENGWASTNRFGRTIESQHDGNKEVEHGFFNGLDYMMLHNLYFINGEASIPDFPFYTNLFDRYVDYTIPYTEDGTPYTGVGNSYGSIVPENPLEIGAYETLIAVNTITANGQVTYRAGREIHLEPPFSVVAGGPIPPWTLTSGNYENLAGTFNAYIEPYHCINGEYKSLANDSLERGKDRLGYSQFPQSPPFLNSPYKTNTKKDNASLTAIRNIQNANSGANDARAIKIIPNPNKGMFTVLISELIQGTSLQIADITGQVIMQSSLNSYQSSIDISGYSSGIYIVQVNYPDGKAERVKVIKE